MKATPRLLTAVLFATLGAGAAAQEATPSTWISGATTWKSRDQVKAELAQARHDGTANAGSTEYDFVVAATAPAKTRAQVRAELAAARASGEYEALNGEVHAFSPAPRSTMYARRAR